MVEPIRITPAEVHKKLQQGTALLVCAYDDEAKYKMTKLEGSISFRAFKEKLPTLPMEQEIVFYCA
jgi:hypothetical protein